MENNNTTASTTPKKRSYDEMIEIMRVNDAVFLTKEEIEDGNRRKKAQQKKGSTFVNSNLYRVFHQTMTNLMENVLLMPKKSVKISDIMLNNLSEVIRWSAAAYEQKDVFLKHNSLCEAISLMYTVKICVNTASSLNLIGKSKSIQLSKSIDSILRQLVAWRGSLQDKGNNEDK